MHRSDTSKAVAKFERVHIGKLSVPGGQPGHLLTRSQEGSARWAPNELTPQVMALEETNASEYKGAVLEPQNKFITLDDNTAALVPSSHNPPLVADTFPSLWPGTTTPITGLRTYHYDIRGRVWVKWAVGRGMDVMVGITLSNYKVEVDALVSDYMDATASMKALYDKHLVAVSVGNEQTDTTRMVTGMQYAKQKRTLGHLPGGCKVTTVLENEGWLQNTYPPTSASFTAAFQPLVAVLEVVCMNLYPYYSRGSLSPLTPPEVLTRSLSWTSEPTSGEYSILLNEFSALRSAMKAAGMPTVTPLWCTETGWSSTPAHGQPDLQPGWSSVEHLRTDYDNFLGFDLTRRFEPQAGEGTMDLPPEKCVWHTVRDVEQMKEWFGLALNKRALQYKF